MSFFLFFLAPFRLSGLEMLKVWQLTQIATAISNRCLTKLKLCLIYVNSNESEIGTQEKHD